MESPEELEKALARLMPSAISTRGMASMEDLIDQLAAGDPGVATTPVRKSRRWVWVGGTGAAAAAIALVLTLPPQGVPARESTPDFTAAAAADPGGLVVVNQTERVEDATPEDWVSESNGVPHRAWRVRVVDQERLRDVATGHEVLITRPREEIRLIPVTSF